MHAIRVKLVAIVVASIFVASITFQTNAQRGSFGNPVKHLPSPLSSFEVQKTQVEGSPDFSNGELKSIALDAFIIWVPEKNVRGLWKATIVGSSEIHRGGHPLVRPTSNLEPNFTRSTEVQASTQSISAWPVRTAAITENVWRRFLAQIKGSTEMNVTQVPTAIIYDGHSAAVSDTQQRPFVVDVETVNKGETVSEQPVVQMFDDGVKFVFKGKIDGDSVLLRGDLAISEVEEVATFRYDDFSDAMPQKKGWLGQTPATTGTVVQVPKVRTTTVHFASSVKQGNAMIIDPFHRVESTTTQKTMFGKKSKTQANRMLLVVLPRVAVQDEVASQ